MSARSMEEGRGGERGGREKAWEEDTKENVESGLESMTTCALSAFSIMSLSQRRHPGSSLWARTSTATTATSFRATIVESDVCIKDRWG